MVGMDCVMLVFGDEQRRIFLVEKSSVTDFWIFPTW